MAFSRLPLSLPKALAICNKAQFVSRSPQLFIEVVKDNTGGTLLEAKMTENSAYQVKDTKEQLLLERAPFNGYITRVG